MKRGGVGWWPGSVSPMGHQPHWLPTWPLSPLWLNSGRGKRNRQLYADSNHVQGHSQARWIDTYRHVDSQRGRHTDRKWEREKKDAGRTEWMPKRGCMYQWKREWCSKQEDPEQHGVEAVKESNEMGCEMRMGLTGTTLILKKGQYQISTAVHFTTLEFIRLQNLCGERQWMLSRDQWPHRIRALKNQGRRELSPGGESKDEIA